MIDLQVYPPSRFWMRAISFVGLRNLVALIRDYSNPMIAKEMIALIKEKKPFFVKDQEIPSNTTIYHYRNTLLHLGILIRDRNRLSIDWSNESVTRLLNCISPQRDYLSGEEKLLFSQLVVGQIDCKTFFADIFWPIEVEEEYGIDQWLSLATPVTWRDVNSTESRKIQLFGLNNERSFQLSTENHIQAILYGVRLWFRDELKIIDEIFKEDKGNIMFPVFPEKKISEEKITLEILNSLTFEQEWARVSLRDLALSLCVELRIPVEYLYTTIRSISRKYQGYVVLIPTSRSFATVTASSTLRERLELRSYLKDDNGVYMSHLRIHRGIKELLQ